ncbi:hypothetical protein GE115_03545 [Agromyces sp. CFH 90414]|uniref:Uncharacterized protein n=1 Tax=Agromyces agglutinans TaxID=2662258 RepID=A0A6I2F9B5_9MICO|nr:acyltransferase domain-containing protein [Agromyces agglutinans]MRG58946.1 hypothetical protein [Agromyces agglutinans]
MGRHNRPAPSAFPGAAAATDAEVLGLAPVEASARPDVTARLRAAVLSESKPHPDASGPVGVASDAVQVDTDASDAELLASLVELVPDALTRHRRLGIPGDVTRATLLDVGRKHRLYGAANVLDWLLEILRGDVVELGRLQVSRRRERYGHAVHIPELGPLDPGAVDRSIARIAAFTRADRLQCTSWLLDPVLQAELPDSNIAAFARRFQLVDHVEPSAEASAEASRFVFRESAERVRDADAVQPRTRLERVVAERLRTGSDWSEPTGILELR